MDTTFRYGLPIDAKNFIGREKELAMLDNLIVSGENVAVYSEPKAGKMSLIRKAISMLDRKNSNFITADISFMRCRTTGDILSVFGSEVIKSVVSSPSEMKQIVTQHLAGTHFTFDPEQFVGRGEVLSPTWLMDEIDMEKIFALPSAIAAEKNVKILIIIDEFQNILFPEESYKLIKTLEAVCQKHDTSVPFIFTGTHLNAMREIFDVHKYFWGSVVRIMLEPMPSPEIVNFYYRGFQQTGKVIEKELIMNSAQILRCNMWYLSHLFSITDQMCHGYVNKTMMSEAIENLISIHRPRFFSSVCSLTDFQLRLLHAILDGETRFSASNIIDKYQLNSSANVKRLKDALVKKELVWFDENDNPHIQDPLFELWLRKDFFNIK